MTKHGILVVLALSFATPMAVADWTASDVADNSKKFLLAGGIGGPVGSMSNVPPDDNGVLVVSLGSNINGSIGSTPASDTKSHSNMPLIKQQYEGSPRLHPQHCAFTVDEVILGAGQSSLQNADSGLWSAYSVQVADITTTPPGSGPGGNLISDTEHLNGSSYYIAPQLVERWTSTITVFPADTMVTGVVTTLSQASVYGWDCSLSSQLTVTLAMDLSTPE